MAYFTDAEMDMHDLNELTHWPQGNLFEILDM